MQDATGRWISPVPKLLRVILIILSLIGGGTLVFGNLSSNTLVAGHFFATSLSENCVFGEIDCEEAECNDSVTFPAVAWQDGDDFRNDSSNLRLIGGAHVGVPGHVFFEVPVPPVI